MTRRHKEGRIGDQKRPRRWRDSCREAANGRKGGRPRKVDDADAAKARQLREKGITATDIAKMLGVSRATAYRYLTDGAMARRKVSAV